MRKIFLLFAFVLVSATLLAVPARPFRFMASQPDGSRIALTPRGDERMHFFLTDDAQPVLCGTDGAYYHATLDAVGQLSPSRVLAHEKTDRDVLETGFLTRRGDVKQLLSGALQKARVFRPEVSTRATSATRASYLGTKRGLVILVQFPDCKFSLPDVQDHYQNVLNGDGAPRYDIPNSVNTYFYDQSNGQFDLEFDVVGPVTVSNNVSYYGSNDSWGNDLNPEKMVEEAVRLASPQVNFSDYDWDGDGFADQIFVLYAGYNEAQGAPSYTIWPHSYYISAGGNRPPVFNGVRIDAYACSSELSGKSGLRPDGIGTFCHEFSHCLGLPDLYDTDYSGGYGMYIWSLMDAGCYCGPNYLGEVPCNYTTYERWMCGWSDFTELDKGCTVTGMSALSDNGPGYVIYNSAHKDEFYLLENRQQTGWDAYLPAHGLLIMHIDYNADAWQDNTVNDSRTHQRFVVVAADNSTNQTISDATGDVYPGKTNNTALTDTSVPAARLFHNNTDGRRYLGHPIEQIAEDADGKISFVFDGGEGNAITGVRPDKETSSAVYSLQGIRQSKPNRPGIYIKNGRKVLVK